MERTCGGSSDAAAVLVALNKLFEAKLGEELAKLGSDHRSDVSFSFSNQPLLQRPRRNRQSNQAEKEISILLLKPAFSFECWAYSRWQVQKRSGNFLSDTEYRRPRFP